MTRKLTFEEVARRVNEFNPDYELTAYKSTSDLTLKYLPTGEEFSPYLHHFLNGRAHAPSIAAQIIQDKKVKTNLEKYGVDNPSKNKYIKEKIRKVYKEKYGVNHPCNSVESFEKMKKTNLEKYGAECSLQNKEVQEKVKKTNLERYGAEHWSLSDKGCIKVKGRTLAEIAEEKQMSISYIFMLYKKGIDILDFQKSEGTSIEQSIKSILNDLDLEFEREKWFNDNKIRADFYVPKSKLIIEANGIYWHSDKKVEKDYHYNRRKILNELGFKVIQFNEIEIIEDPVRVKYMIKDMIETGGKESYIYEDDYLIVNLDYSIPPANFELIEEWIGEYDINRCKIYNSGMQKYRQ